MDIHVGKGKKSTRMPPVKRLQKDEVGDLTCEEFNELLFVQEKADTDYYLCTLCPVEVDATNRFGFARVKKTGSISSFKSHITNHHSEIVNKSPNEVLRKEEHKKIHADLTKLVADTHMMSDLLKGL